MRLLLFGALLLLSTADTEARKGKGKGRGLQVSNQEWLVPARWCTVEKSTDCCGDGICNGPEDANTCMADCPGVITDATCGEEPHSDRGGRGLTFGVSHRAKSAQDCCDKCKAHAKGCNSWTFCGYPVCFGLDTGWNHTFGGTCSGSTLPPLVCPSP